jgi:hypothetical protein
VAQWVGDKVEVIWADEAACVFLAEPQVDVQGGGGANGVSIWAGPHRL